MPCANCDMYGICRGRCFDENSSVEDIDTYLLKRLETCIGTRNALIRSLSAHKKKYEETTCNLSLMARNRALDAIRQGIDLVNAEIKLISDAFQIQVPPIRLHITSPANNQVFQ